MLWDKKKTRTVRKTKQISLVFKRLTQNIKANDVRKILQNTFAKHAAQNFILVLRHTAYSTQHRQPPKTNTHTHTHTHSERNGKNVALLALFRVNLNCFLEARWKDVVYWDATQRSLTEIHGRFEGVCCLRLHDRTHILHEDGASILGSCPYTSKTSIFLLSSDEGEISYI